SVTEISSVLEEPARAAGFHFFNPAPRMKLVEIVPGYDTSDQTVASLYEVAADLGKKAVRVNESPGGIVSRLQLLVRNEAIRLLAEGVATAEDIDTAMKLGSGWPLGPLELTDLVGLDLHVNNSDSLAEEMGSERYRPHPLARKLVRAGHLGRKSGEGFHSYGERP
ncbi:MAG: 3-hydroxyacyl-CoA dehydrogenase family protein, partial [Acidimicrobiia bacterium]